MPKLMTALENAQNNLGTIMILGEPEHVVERDNVVMAIEKMKPEGLANGTSFNKTSALQLEFNSSAEDLGETSELQMQVGKLCITIQLIADYRIHQYSAVDNGLDLYTVIQT